MKDGLSLPKLIDKTIPFFSALDPIVDIALFMTDIFNIKDSIKTSLFLLASTFAILFYELVIPCVPLAIGLFVLSNSYFMRRF